MTQPKRSEDEQLALHLFRYKNWAATVDRDHQQMMALQEQMTQLADHLSYSLLEAREEQENLLTAGMSQEEIESVAVLPQLPIDPLVILKRARSRSRVEGALANRKGGD